MSWNWFKVIQSPCGEDRLHIDMTMLTPAIEAMTAPETYETAIWLFQLVTISALCLFWSHFQSDEFAEFVSIP